MLKLSRPIVDSVTQQRSAGLTTPHLTHINIIKKEVPEDSCVVVAPLQIEQQDGCKLQLILC